jgi:glycolate oxidase FAD binding subunit
VSLAPGTRARLLEALGDDGVEEAGPLDVDGARPSTALRPGDGEALGRALSVLSGAGAAVLVRGGGTRLGLGNPPRPVDAVLCTERLAGMDEFDPGEGVCHLGAGTRLADARRALREGAWELPLDAPGEGATLGGVIAAGALGPRAQGFGLPRDVVLGLEVALASGARTRCGGRVVKNVTGYDLARLYAGSLGTLGVIEAAWLRLRPRPGCVRLLEARLPRAGVGEAGLAAARRPTTRASAVLCDGGDVSPAGGDGRRASLVVELAGDAPAVDRDAAWLARELGAGDAEAGALDRMRALQGSLPGEGGLRFRVSALPSRLDAVLSLLSRSRVALLAYPGLGLVFAGFPLEGEDTTSAAAAFDASAAAARASGGSAVCEQAPGWAKRGRDVFGEAGELLPLTQELKRRFDPKGVLNPGRFLGHL